MRKDRFMMWVSAVFATMMVVRVVVMSAPAERLILGRAGTADLALAVGMIAILALVHQRLLTSRLSGWWLLPVALWLIAAVPVLRAVIGQPLPEGSYPGPIQFWPEIPMLLLAFFAFAAFIEPPGDKGLTLKQKQMEWAAALIAAVSLMARPYLLIVGLERLPYFSTLLSVSPETVAVLRDIEEQFNVVKDVGGHAPGLGNALTISLFCIALAAIVAFAGEAVAARGRRRALGGAPAE
ncbi:MAG: hypothetical protein KKH72_14850 [Alphaproteobacteria bacterium]|nr:hypothetical protein [Alphaproteobacteria bacterium]